jgi:hypothetical protein
MGKLPKVAVGVAVLLLSAGTTWAAAPPTGLRVYAETWDPTKINGEGLAPLFNSPTALSDAMNSAWTAFRGWYLGTMPGLLAGADYLHTVSPAVPKGITLYSRSHDFHKPPELTLPAQADLQLVPEGTNAFEANLHVPASTISFCATTPSKVGKEGDPCATFTVDVTLGMAIKIGDNSSRMLQITGASVSLSQFGYNNENLSSQVLEALADVVHFFGGPDYQALLVKTVDSQRVSVTNSLQKPVDQLNGQLASYQQTALNDINQGLKGVGAFSQLMHVGVWARSSPSQQYLTLVFAPPNTGLSLDAAHQAGQFSGTLTFDPGVTSLPTSCAVFNNSPRIAGQAQVGPRSIVALDAAGNPVYGNAPMQGLAVAFNGSALQGRQCSYTLGRLVIGLPNFINFTNIQVKPSGMPQVQQVLDIEPSHWSSPVVVGPNGVVVSTGGAVASTAASGRTMTPVAMRDPQISQGLNLLATEGMNVQQGAGAMPRGQTQVVTSNPGDPALRQGLTTATNPGVTSTPGVASIPGVTSTPGVATTSSSRVPTTSTAPVWGQPGAASVPSNSTFNSPMGTSMRGSTTTLQQPTTQPGLRNAPSSLGQQ